MVLFAKDIIEKDFVSQGREVKVLEAAKLMRDKRHGFVVVVSSNGTPEGVVTEWDLLSKVIAEERDPSQVKLSDVMSGNLVTINANEGIDQVAKIMAEKGIRRVFVLQNGEMIGVITARTVLSRLKEYVDKISAQIARLQAPVF